MALQSSGNISLGDIAEEFNDTEPTSISEFYDAPAGVGGTIPASGTISFSDFHGASNSFTTSYTTFYSSGKTSSSRTTSRTTNWR